ncbi:MAG: 5'/3'-nucleotidase SurE [Pirellulales bacterium]|nr:5'/3'-nucleotidase SurE [Planctomycetales bacterium]
MRILLTNDDGIFAPGLRALERELRKIGHVDVVAPATEQSGVGHSITFLSPLVAQEVYEGEDFRGWSVEGSPADSVKIGIHEFCQQRPDLVVSGMNAGLNAGINVLYSGTVAAAIEGAFFGITSIAVSLEWSRHPALDRAAQLAGRLIEQILQQKGPQPQLFNLNFPTAALVQQAPEVHVVPMAVLQYGEKYERRKDPRGRNYYWATGGPPPPVEGAEDDISALAQGHITLTPLDFDLTARGILPSMQSWRFETQG